MTVFSEFLIIMLLAIGASVLAGLGARRLAFVQKFKAQQIDRAFTVLVLGYIVLFTMLTVLRYLSFNIGYLDDYTSWDLGQYDQIVWNSLHGQLFETCFFPDVTNFLGKSFTPILLMFVPLYAVWASPIVLLVAQTVALALGALPLYWFARVRVGQLLAFVIGLAYLLSPAVQNINIAEFHEVALLTPLLIYTTFFLLRRHYAGFLVCLGLSLMVKEEAGLIAIMFGMYLFLFQRQRALGAGLTVFGIAWTILLLQYLIPYFRTGEWGGVFYYFGEGKLTGARYAYLGKSISEIAMTILTRPDIVLSEILQPPKIAYVLYLLVPLALLPLIGAEISMLSLPTLGYTLLSQYAHQYSLAAAYHAPILPFLFFGAIVGVERALKWKPRHQIAYQSALAVFLLITSIASYWQEAPGPFARKFQPNRYVVNAHTAIGHRLIALVPEEGVVAAQNELIAYLTHRLFISEVSVKNYRQFDYLVADATKGWYQVHISFWEPYLASGYFDVIGEEDGWIVARRRVPNTPLQISFDGKMTLLAYTLVPKESLQGGQTLRPIVMWQANAAIQERYVIQAHLVDQYGHAWKSDEQEPQGGALPTNQWLTGQDVPDQYWLHIDHTVPTGEYRITVRVYDPAKQTYLSARDANGNDLGEEITLAVVQIQKSQASLTASQVEIEHRLVANIGEMQLLGYTLPRQTMRANEPFHIGLFWRALTKPRGDYFVDVQLRDMNARIMFEQQDRPAKGTYPTPQWATGEVLLDWHDFDLPQNLAAGEYQILVSLRDATDQHTLGETKITTIMIAR